MMTLQIDHPGVENVIQQQARVQGSSPTAVLVQTFMMMSMGIPNFDYDAARSAARQPQKAVAESPQQ
jgi:hypothetical protein